MGTLRIPVLRLDGVDEEQKRSEIRRVFQQTFSLYEELFEHLATAEAWYQKAIPLRHPLIFYFGHTATFYTNKFLVAGLIHDRIDPHLESIFAVGVDEMSWDDLDESHYDWPSVESVQAYRAQVREMVDEVIQNLPLTLPIGWDSPWWAVLMGIEHENIHLETSSVLIRQLPMAWVRPVPSFAPEPVDSHGIPVNVLVPIPGGYVRLGKEENDPRYGWDNEYGYHEAQLKDFAAARYLVSNGEFLPFVEAGGYRESRWWTEEGDAWRRYAKVQYPTFWREQNGGWFLRLLAEERSMPWSWPVEVNVHEAQAFCAWKSAQLGQNLRLPSEDEWRYLLHRSGLPASDAWQDPVPAQIGLAYGVSPCPVDRFPQGDCYDLMGNVWEWTATPIYPFAGFRVHPIYDDFTVPTFDQQHNLLKGGSFISLGNETQAEARYAFRRHFFQHAGFRYVKSENPLPEVPVYESDTQVSQYCHFHFGTERYFGVDNYPKAMADLCLALSQNRSRKRALDIGCAVGRSSFELARGFSEVIGIDFSTRFIQIAVLLQQRGRLPYAIYDEGELQSYHWADLDRLGLKDVAQRVQFFQGDAANLKPIYRDFDLVLAANLIDRLRDPARFLQEMAQRILPGGLLVLSSPYTWLEEFTPKENWLGGVRRDGENRTTLAGIRAVLESRFRLLEGFPLDLPFVIRETRRKFQHSLAEVSVWERC